MWEGRLLLNPYVYGGMIQKFLAFGVIPQVGLVRKKLFAVEVSPKLARVGGRDSPGAVGRLPPDLGAHHL